MIPIEDLKKGALQKAVRSSNQNSTHLNKMLDQVYTKITSVELRLKREDKVPTGDLVHKMYDQDEIIDVSGRKDMSMIALLEQFLQAKSYTSNTHKLFKTLQKHLEAHIGEMPASEFNLATWTSFRGYLSETKKLSADTICIRLAKLRTFIKFYQKDGLEIPIKSFPLPKEEIKQVYLDANSLRAIRDFVPPTEALAIVKDLCLFQCFTGLRVSDLFRVKEHHIGSNGGDLYYLTMKSHKTNTSMLIPLSEEALSILQKHSFKLPVIVEQYYNRQLKRLARLAGVNKIWEWQAYNHKGEKITKQENPSRVSKCGTTAGMTGN